MNLRQTFVVASCIAGIAAGCGGSSATSALSSSEIAIDAVSGALNTTNGSAVALNDVPLRRGVLSRVLAKLNPIRPAWAASWTCTGASLTPAFNGPGSYIWSPPSCSVTLGDAAGSSSWSSTFTLTYGAGCDSTHPWIDHQSAGCQLTRTTGVGGNTRTISTLDGATRVVTHDTNGAGTGWDATVTPVPSNAGVVISCGATGCDSSRTIAINGSHLVGTVTSAGGTTRFDHTISTGSGGLTVTGSGTSRSVSGTVTVQHNLTRNTASVAFTNVMFGDAGCPFPTSGTVTASFTDGPQTGMAETTTFSAAKCGGASITVDGTTRQVTLAGPI
jgi:hypothetical protein